MRVKLLLRTDRWIAGLEQLLMAIACGLFAVIMLVVSADALGRYFLNAPLTFANDLVTRYALPGGFFLAFAYTFRGGGHVAVEFLARRIAPHRYQVAIGMLFLFASAILWTIAALGAMTTWHAFATGEAMGGLHRWLIWPSELLVPLGMGVLALRVTHAALANLLAGIAKVPGIAYPAESAEAEMAFATANKGAAAAAAGAAAPLAADALPGGGR